MFTISSFRSIENKYDVYRGNDCMKKFCELLREHAMKIIIKVRDHCHYTGEYRGAAHSICYLRYSVPKKSPIVFHNGSNYDYHFIIKESAEEFKNQFTSLGENTGKIHNHYNSIRKRSYKK